jgi:ankyrin repeat protein
LLTLITTFICLRDLRFLLAQLYLGSLEDKTTVKAMKSALKQFQKKPQGSSENNNLEVLSLAYEQAMERINAQKEGFQLLAKNVLSWITCAKRPLTTRELQHAIAVEINAVELDEENLSEIEDMVSVCAGLVTIDEESNIIRLVHYTTQEYFNQTQKRWFLDAETNITKTCVTYLSFDAFDTGFCRTDKEFEVRLQDNVLYDYASHNWGDHARAASTLILEVISFLERKAQVEASTQGLLAKKLYSQRFTKEMTGLHLGAYFGVKTTVQLLLDRDADVKAADGDGGTPLHWASERGHVKTAQLLLDRGADIKAADKGGGMPLHRASEHGHVKTIQLLLDRGADVKAADKGGGTPLHRASERGHVKTIQLLLDQGADVKAADGGGGTPLHRASERGHVKTIQLLLDRGADIKAADKSGGTPLYRASEHRHVKTIQLLLDRGADVVK